MRIDDLNRTILEPIREGVETIGGARVWVDSSAVQMVVLAAREPLRGLVVDNHTYLWSAHDYTHAGLLGVLKFDDPEAFSRLRKADAPEWPLFLLTLKQGSFVLATEAGWGGVDWDWTKATPIRDGVHLGATEGARQQWQLRSLMRLNRSGTRSMMESELPSYNDLPENEQSIIYGKGLELLDWIATKHKGIHMNAAIFRDDPKRYQDEFVRRWTAADVLPAVQGMNPLRETNPEAFERLIYEFLDDDSIFAEERAGIPQKVLDRSTFRFAH